MLDDQQLLALAQQLMVQIGRPPRLGELVEAAGGCQRQRASRAIAKLREAVAEKAVRSRLIMPPILEAQLRSWVESWMETAATQLAQIHAQLQQAHDDESNTASEMIQEQQAVLQTQREHIADLERMLSELSTQNQRLTVEIGQVRAERDIAQAVAEERLRQLGS